MTGPRARARKRARLAERLLVTACLLAIGWVLGRWTASTPQPAERHARSIPRLETPPTGSSSTAVVGTTGVGREEPAAPREAGTPDSTRSDDIATLRARDLLVPVQGVPSGSLLPGFSQPRGGHTHEALDIQAPRGTPVLAVEAGRIAKLFTSTLGGLTIYQFDPGEQFAYYYAHLDRYAPDLREGAQVRRGQVIGYVGSTGNAPPDAPHLHFAVFRLGPERRWWAGTPLDPFRIWR